MGSSSIAGAGDSDSPMRSRRPAQRRAARAQPTLGPWMNRNPATGQELKTAGKIVAQGAAGHVGDACEQSTIGTGGTQLFARREHGSRCSNILAFDLIAHADHVGARTGKSNSRGSDRIQVPTTGRWFAPSGLLQHSRAGWAPGSNRIRAWANLQLQDWRSSLAHPRP